MRRRVYLDLSAGNLLQLLGGATILALGVFCLWTRPGTAATRAYGWAQAGLGVAFVAMSLSFLFIPWEPGDLAHRANPLVTATMAAGYLLGAAALLHLARIYPEPLTLQDRWPIAATLATLAVALWMEWQNVGWAFEMTLADYGGSTINRFFFLAWMVGIFALFPVLTALLVLFATRYPRAPGARAERRAAFALLSAGLALPWCTMAAANIMMSTEIPEMVPYATYQGVMILVFLALWGWNVTSRDRDTSRVARHVALVLVATPAITLAIVAVNAWVLGGSVQSTAYPAAIGLMFTLGVAVIAYGILRHQLLDIDLAVKWTIKQSTIASVFALVFIVTSETLEGVIQAKNAFVGVSAAVALAVVLQPLQRTAERLASRLLPGVEDSPSYRQHRRVQVYRGMVEELARDGSLSERDHEILASLRARLQVAEEPRAVVAEARQVA